MKRIENYPNLDKWCDDNYSDEYGIECYPLEQTEDQLIEMQEQIDKLKETLEFARKFVGHGLVDLNEDGNNIVTIKSVIDEVLEGEE